MAKLNEPILLIIPPLSTTASAPMRTKLICSIIDATLASSMQTEGMPMASSSSRIFSPLLSGSDSVTNTLKRAKFDAYRSKASTTREYECVRIALPSTMNCWLYSDIRCRESNVRWRKTSPRTISFRLHSSIAYVSSLAKVIKRRNRSQPDFKLGIEESVWVVSILMLDFNSWTSSLSVPAEERLITSSNVRIAIVAIDNLVN